MYSGSYVLNDTRLYYQWLLICPNSNGVCHVRPRRRCSRSNDILVILHILLDDKTISIFKKYNAHFSVIWIRRLPIRGTFLWWMIHIKVWLSENIWHNSTSLLLQILSTLVTYFVVVIQFKPSDQPPCQVDQNQQLLANITSLLETLYNTTAHVWTRDIAVSSQYTSLRTNLWHIHYNMHTYGAPYPRQRHSPMLVQSVSL